MRSVRISSVKANGFVVICIYACNRGRTKLGHSHLVRSLSFTERHLWLSWVWIGICKHVPGALGNRLWSKLDPFHYRVKEICIGDLAGVTWKERDEEEGRKSAGGYRDDPRLGLRCSVAKSCLALCDPVDCSMQGSTVLHSLWESAQIHVHWVGDSI